MADEASGLSQELARAISRIYRRARAERARGELGDAATGVLVILHRDGPHSLSRLCERERVTPGSMSQTVNRLTEAGYARRSGDPTDGRRVIFTITASGAELAVSARAHMYDWLDGRLGRLDDADRATLARAALVLQDLADS